MQQALITISGLSFLLWFLYWNIAEIKTDKEKKTKSVFRWHTLASWIFLCVIYGIITSQFFGKKILPISNAPFAMIFLGFILVFLGHAISIAARISLGSNWSSAQQYQIKEKHELITSGIYSYIRHPIYTGMIVSLIGAVLVLGSWLWISFLGLFFGGYVQGKREEKILLHHFGEKYKKYMKHTKMLIPFIV